MKPLSAVLVIAVAAALAVFALDPRTDVACALTRVYDLAYKRHAGWQCLHYAAARGDVSALRASLADGVSPNARTRRGQTALILAAEHGQLAVVQTLIRRGAQLEARDGRNGFTALHWAADRYHPAVARALLAAGARVDAENKWQQTPLWQAAWQTDQGNTEIAHILVGAGADISAAGDKGNTPLHMAARAGHRPMIEYLLERGADIEAHNQKDRTPLFQAVAGNHPESVRLLLARGADSNTTANGTPALAFALDHGERRVADLLVANGATGYEHYAASAAMARGRRAYVGGEYDAAIRAYGAAIALRPDGAEGYYRRGLAFLAAGSIADAEGDLRQALSLDAGQIDAREALGRLYVERGDYAQAVDTLDPLLASQPDNAHALYLLGESRHALGQTEQAHSRFARACALGFEPACSR